MSSPSTRGETEKGFTNGDGIHAEKYGESSVKGSLGAVTCPAPAESQSSTTKGIASPSANGPITSTFPRGFRRAAKRGFLSCSEA